ncbi:hypothetical protein M0804_007905 [Polistes exclamans]|nr:hypothetical protein M0804_007905 [Polistes exclamans]
MQAAASRCTGDHASISQKGGGGAVGVLTYSSAHLFFRAGSACHSRTRSRCGADKNRRRKAKYYLIEQSFGIEEKRKMTTESLPREVDAHIVNILTRLSNIRDNNVDAYKRIPMSTEARSLELWKAVLVECVATFLFVFAVSGAASSTAVSGSGLSILATAIASGFVVSAIYFIFGHVSGSHINPAVSLSFFFLRRISPLRAALYIAAQCGGGIAGAATLYT